MNKNQSFYAGVVLLSAVVTGMQILQSRVFSVTTWYHLSFIVISIAMFGLTLGALAVYRGDEKTQRASPGLMAAKASFMCGVCMLLALMVQMRVPLVYSDFKWTFVALPVVGILTGLPYYFAGVALSACLTRTAYPVGRIYGADLLGAAAGCLGALAIMHTVDTPSGLLLLAGAAAIAALLFASENAPLRCVAGGLAILAVLAGFGNAALPRPLLYPLWVKSHVIKESGLDYDRWNSISRVTVSQEQVGRPFLWGPSPAITAADAPLTAYKWLIIDGDAGTVITKFDGQNWPSLHYLDFDVTNLAYHLPSLNRTAIIGVGGGRDLLSAKYFGVKDVIAMDVNPIQIDLLSRDPVFRSYSNLYSQPGVTLVNSEARSWFRRNTQPFDLIEMSLIDTWASTGAGAFALSENGLYTREAWSTFFASLAPDGVFTVSRWFRPEAPNEAARQISLAVATLLKAGIADPDQHIFMATSGRIATMLVSRAAFSDGQLAILEKQCADKKFNILVTPRNQNYNPAFRPFLQAHSLDELNQAANGMDFDLSPPTDMRPFFFNQVRFSHPAEVARLAFADTSGTFSGHAKATFNLFIMIGFAFLMTLAVIILPLIGDIKHESRAFVAAGTGYFLLIGLGFMLLEISLLQGFGVFLGHPVYGLSIVLFSLILSTGLGSFVSERYPLRTTAQALFWCGGILACTLALSFYLSDLFAAFGTASLPGRAGVCVMILAPLGILLGYGFPTGMRLTTAIDSRATAWFWGINGAAGVLSSALAIAFNIALGIDKTILLGGVCYALLFPLMALLRRMETRTAV